MDSVSDSDKKPSALALRIAQRYCKRASLWNALSENGGPVARRLAATVDAEIAPLVDALSRAEFAVEDRWRRETDPVKRSGLRDDVDAVREALARAGGAS